MEKYVVKLLCTLKVEAVVAWLIAVVTVVLGELNVIPNGLVAPATQEEFLLNLIAIVLTVAGIPLAVRLFTLNTTRGLRRMNNDEALVSYHVWSGLRMSILCLVAVFCLTVYYVATSVSALFCALITLCITIYCWPKKEKIDTYLEAVHND